MVRKERVANSVNGRLTACMLAGATLASACASMSGDSTLQAWRKVGQVEQRFAVFVSEPGVREDTLATFRMRFVYMPGEVKHEGKEVAWQEYHAMTIDCAKNTVRLGSRTRYAPGGAEITTDDDQTFDEILFGTSADDAARAKCKGDFRVGDITFPEGPGWMDEARKHIAATPPPKRS
ncbi:MAG: hypothetical protein ACOYMK_09825 [Hyphomonadaceae bacterium]